MGVKVIINEVKEKKRTEEGKLVTTGNMNYVATIEFKNNIFPDKFGSLVTKPFAAKKGLITGVEKFLETFEIVVDKLEDNTIKEGENKVGNKKRKYDKKD